MEKEIESILRSFIELSPKQQTECLHALVNARSSEEMHLLNGDKTTNEIIREEYRRPRSWHRDRIF